MAYIGKQPVVGNFQKCDAITVVNGQAAYTLNVGGSAVNPENANHMLVSLNGVLQAPGDSFTVSGSTLTFASNLATGDVIDFVIILGDVLDLGTPSDNTVTAAKLNNDIISGQTALATAPDDTDEFLVSDAGTIKRIDYSLIKSNPTHVLLQTQTVSSAVTEVDFTSNIDSTYKVYMLDIINMNISSAATQALIRFFQGGSLDTGSIYDSGAHRTRNDSSTTLVHRRENADNIWFAYDVRNDATASINSKIYIYDPADTNFHTKVQFHSSYEEHNGIFSNSIGAGRIEETTAVDGLRIALNTGNINSGTFKLYGIN